MSDTDVVEEAGLPDSDRDNESSRTSCSTCEGGASIQPLLCSECEYEGGSSLVFIDIIVLSRAVSPAVVGSGGVRCEHRQEGVGGEEDERGGGRRKYQEVCYVMIII
jgi:hypothetical protein